jgi:hypothetical protein
MGMQTDSIQLDGASTNFDWRSLPCARGEKPISFRPIYSQSCGTQRPGHHNRLCISSQGRPTLVSADSVTLPVIGALARNSNTGARPPWTCVIALRDQGHFVCSYRAFRDVRGLCPQTSLLTSPREYTRLGPPNPRAPSIYPLYYA